MKKSILLLIAGILGICYFIYLVSHFGGSLASSNDDAELLGVGIATALVMPHMFCVLIAVVFNVIAWIGNVRWASLVAGIMYAIAMITFLLYALYVLAQMILCFVAFAKMKQLKSNK